MVEVGISWYCLAPSTKTRKLPNMEQKKNIFSTNMESKMAELTSLETKAEGASTNKKYQIPNFFTQFWVLGSTHWINDVNKNLIKLIQKKKLKLN